jgi:hypothetical protein
MLLIVTHLFAGNFGHDRNFWRTPSGLECCPVVRNTLATVFNCSADLTALYFSSEVPTQSIDILFLEYDEDEENEVHSFSKGMLMGSEGIHKKSFSYNDADAFRAQHGALNNEHVSDENVYLLYHVLRI